jgi:hypothetical protein
MVSWQRRTSPAAAVPETAAFFLNPSRFAADMKSRGCAPDGTGGSAAQAFQGAHTTRAPIRAALGKGMSRHGGSPTSGSRNRPGRGLGVLAVGPQGTAALAGNEIGDHLAKVVVEGSNPFSRSS